MLKGTIVYNGKYKYDVKGVDSSTTLRLVMSTNNAEAIQCMESEEGDMSTPSATALWSRIIDIKMARCGVETGKVEQANGRKKNNPVNTNLFCRLSAILRYAKAHCTTKSLKGFIGITLASGEFAPEAESEYEIVLDETKGYKAQIVLQYGDIKSIYLTNDYFDIELSDIDSTEILDKPSNAVQIGIKFSEDYLGFGQKPQELADTTHFEGVMYQNLEELIKAHPDKEFSWLRGKDYRIVTDDTVDSICEYLYNHDGYVYFDTETTGLKITFRSRYGQDDQCVGIILSVKDGESFYFPMQMRSIKNLCNGDHFYFMEHYIRRILERKKIVVHNAAFDWKVAYIYDINTNIVDDTMAMVKMSIGEEKEKMPVGLKPLTEMILHRDAIELDDIVVGDKWDGSVVKFWDLPEELVRLYACADTDDTMGVHRYMLDNDILGKYNAHTVYNIELTFALAVGYQEFYGHHFDVSSLENMKSDIDTGMATVSKEITDIVGHDFNINSPVQLQKVLYEELHYPEQRDRASGKVTTNKEALKELAEITNENDEPMYPVCVLLQKYREYEGVRKIIDKLPEYMTDDGYVFSGVKQYGARTGRVSIEKPNYQSYNDPVKKNVVPRQGYYMFDTDYSSVEYRVLGNMAGNEMIKQNFYDPDFDYHTYQAARMYGVPYAAVTGKLRKAAKGINFGLPYGMGDQSLGVRIFGEASDENTKKAAALRKSYFKGQEDIKDFFEKHRDKGVAEGFTETYFGRRRYYDKNKYSEGKIRRQAGNAVIQGSSADIYKLAVGRVFQRICKEGWLGKVLFDGFIHDELLGEVSTDIDPMKFLKVLREEFEVKVMDENGKPWCPLYMGFGWGMSWYQAKKTEVPIKLQWEFVDKYGETGYPLWDGNSKPFCDSIPDLIREFSIRDSITQITNPDNQGKEIKPALNSMILDIIKEDKGLYDKYFADHDTVDADAQQRMHIVSPMYAEDGSVIRVLPKTDDTQEALDIFCAIHGVSRQTVDIRSIMEANADNQMKTLLEVEETDEETLRARNYLEAQINQRVWHFGLYVDTINNRIYCKALDGEVFIEKMKLCMVPITEGKGYQVWLRQYPSGEPNQYRDFETQYVIPIDNVQLVQIMYRTLGTLGG